MLFFWFGELEYGSIRNYSFWSRRKGIRGGKEIEKGYLNFVYLNFLLIFELYMYGINLK